MNATYKQIDYIRRLGAEIHDDEYWVNDHLGISRSANLTKKLTGKQASEIIDELLAAKDGA
ncbi:MAG: hypothetical protein ACREGK_05465 [Geminicoccales bacterium]